MNNNGCPQSCGQLFYTRISKIFLKLLKIFLIYDIIVFDCIRQYSVQNCLKYAEAELKLLKAERKSLKEEIQKLCYRISNGFICRKIIEDKKI